MSVESDLSASLLAHAPLAALVATRLAPDKVVQGAARPYIVYVVERDPTYTLDGALACTQYKFRFQCWHDTREGVEAVANALEAALLASTIESPAGIPIESREVINEHDLDLEGTEIAADLWIDA